MDTDARIFVAGGETLIGAALLRRLYRNGFTNVVADATTEPDLTQAGEVDAFFAETRPEYVFLAAGKSGGIQANQQQPAELMLHNLQVQTHVIDAAYRHGVENLLYLASSCSYPKHCSQPMAVESLMTGSLEPTNDAYATAKIAGIKLCQAYSRQYGVKYMVAIPANAFGCEDDFSPEGGHVIPALIAKFHDAKSENCSQVEVWGTGTPRREFIYADDLADACLFVMREYNDSETPINLGCGDDLSIADVAEAISQTVGYQGTLDFDTSKPDGMPLKSLDSTKLIELGWQPTTPFAIALEETYDAFLQSRGCSTEKETHARAVL